MNVAAVYHTANCCYQATRVTEPLLRPSHHTANAQNLGAKITAAQAAGVHDVSFYNYGILPEVSLEWIRTALSPA